MFDEPTYFDPYAKVAVHGNNLPHWQQGGRTYFITFRLADSLPILLVEEWKADRDRWLKRHPRPWDQATEQAYHREFSARIDAALDAGHGECVLATPEIAQAVLDVLLKFDGKRYQIWGVVLMPNHVHLLVSLPGESNLPKQLKAWKGVSARRVNELAGENGEVWQQNYFDRIIRNQDHFVRASRYIRRNPEKAGIREGRFLLWESGLVRDWLA